MKLPGTKMLEISFYCEIDPSSVMDWVSTLKMKEIQIRPSISGGWTIFSRHGFDHSEGFKVSQLLGKLPNAARGYIWDTRWPVLIFVCPQEALVTRCRPGFWFSAVATLRMKGADAAVSLVKAVALSGLEAR
jgi:hypothetical protein